MVRRTGTSRVGGGGESPADRGPAEPNRYPSLRERKPVVFWTIVIAVLAMVLSTGASFVTAFL